LALHTAIYRPNSLTLVVSPSQRQSSELFRKILGFRDRMDPAPVLLERNVLSCLFENKARIVSLPGDEKTVRGYSAPKLIVEDEAARVDDQLYRTLRPMLAVSPGGRLVLMSTPFGRQNHFWTEWSEGEGWDRVEVPATAVPRISPDFLATERLALGESWFSQEYLCSFVQASNQVFSAEDVARAISRDVEPLFATAPAAGAVIPLFSKLARTGC
jgi:hypothetical protein